MRRIWVLLNVYETLSKPTTSYKPRANTHWLQHGLGGFSGTSVVEGFPHISAGAKQLGSKTLQHHRLDPVHVPYVANPWTLLVNSM